MDAIELMLTRESALKLQAPGPSADELERIFASAVRAPDHGRLRPWQFVVINEDQRGAFGDLMAESMRRRDPTAGPGELARDLLEQGIRGMKVWPFDPYAAATSGHDISPEDLRAGVSVIEQIRDAVGDAMDIHLEMHAVWHLPAAIRIAKAVEPLAPYWFEDAVKAHDLEAAARFAASTHVPAAMGETLAGRWTFRRLLDSGAAQIVMFDIGWVGGLSEASAIAALAESYELPIAPHDCTGPVVLTSDVCLLMENLQKDILPSVALAYDPAGTLDGYAWIKHLMSAEGADVIFAHDAETFKKHKQSPEFYE